MLLESQTATANQQKPPPALRLFQPNSPTLALGLAIDHLMGKPAFARLPFGDWSRVLIGQINRKHYCFVADRNNRVQGFAGWALTDRNKAEAWISGKQPLSSQDSRAGDCVIFNAWSAEKPAVHQFMLAEFRKIFGNKRYLYFRRHYNNGRTRSVRLPVLRAGKTNAAFEAA